MNPAMVSFNTTMRQMTEMFQWQNVSAKQTVSMYATSNN